MTWVQGEMLMVCALVVAIGCSRPSSSSAPATTASAQSASPNAEHGPSVGGAVDQGPERTVECPPTARFADVGAVCAELSRLHAHDREDDPDRAACDTGILELPTEGEGPGELLVVSDVSDVSDYALHYLALRTENGIELFGKLGESWERSCSVGSIEASARWSTGGEATTPMLVVDLHEVGEYSCDDTRDDVEVTDERYRMICANEQGRYRCSAPGSSRDGIHPGARPGPLPEGEALRALLVCPPR